MFHACVEKFDVMGTIGKILGTKRGLKHLTECQLIVQRLLERTFRLDIYAAREYELLLANTK